MKAKKIKIVKNWWKLKTICNIQVFLGFNNFYQQFIQGFSRIIALLILILKVIRLLDKPAPLKKNSSTSQFLVKMIITSQLLKEITIIVKIIDLVIIE